MRYELGSIFIGELCGFGMGGYSILTPCKWLIWEMTQTNRMHFTSFLLAGVLHSTVLKYVLYCVREYVRSFGWISYTSVGERHKIRLIPNHLNNEDFIDSSLYSFKIAPLNLSSSCGRYLWFIQALSSFTMSSTVTIPVWTCHLVAKDMPWYPRRTPWLHHQSIEID